MPDCFLAFDFGMKRIGVAVGQGITKTARPLEYIHAKDGIPDWIIVEKIIDKWRPEKLIVGVPFNMDGTEQEITYCARNFAKRLLNHFNVPIIMVDERLTTKEARSQLFENGGYKALKKGEIDSMAAKIMLEDWLNGTSS